MQKITITMILMFVLSGCYSTYGTRHQPYNYGYNRDYSHKYNNPYYEPRYQPPMVVQPRIWVDPRPYRPLVVPHYDRNYTPRWEHKHHGHHHGHNGHHGHHGHH